MGLEFVKPVEKELGYTRVGTTIKFNGEEVATENDEGFFEIEGVFYSVTSQDASGKIEFKKEAKKVLVESDLEPVAPIQIPPTREELLEKAKELGIEVPTGTKTAKLISMIEAYELLNNGGE